MQCTTCQTGNDHTHTQNSISHATKPCAYMRKSKPLISVLHKRDYVGGMHECECRENGQNGVHLSRLWPSDRIYLRSSIMRQSLVHACRPRVDVLISTLVEWSCSCDALAYEWQSSSPAEMSCCATTAKHNEPGNSQVALRASQFEQPFTQLNHQMQNAKLRQDGAGGHWWKMCMFYRMLPGEALRASRDDSWVSMND